MRGKIMKTILLAGIAALSVLSAVQVQADEWCAILCMVEVPRGTEKWELTKPTNGRCTQICGAATRADCESVTKIAKDHGLQARSKCYRDIDSKRSAHDAKSDVPDDWPFPPTSGERTHVDEVCSIPENCIWDWQGKGHPRK